MPSDEQESKKKQTQVAYDEREVSLKYWELVGGTLYMEVRVGKQGLDTAARWIDAVRIPGGERRKQWLEKRVNQTEFKGRISGAEVEVVEAKRKLNRSVIGQVVVAKHLLEMEYETTMAVPIIVCDEGDALLEKVCRAMGIRVWTTQKGFIVPQRPAYSTSATPI